MFRVALRSATYHMTASIFLETTWLVVVVVFFFQFAPSVPVLLFIQHVTRIISHHPSCGRGDN